MATAAIIIGGAVVNALAFSGTSYGFSMLGKGSKAGLERERVRHDQAVEQLQKAQALYSEKRSVRLDWLNEQLKRSGEARYDFEDVSEAFRAYREVAPSGALQLEMTEDPPVLSDYYHPPPSSHTGAVALATSAAVGYALLHRL